MWEQSPRPAICQNHDHLQQLFRVSKFIQPWGSDFAAPVLSFLITARASVHKFQESHFGSQTSCKGDCNEVIHLSSLTKALSPQLRITGYHLFQCNTNLMGPLSAISIAPRKAPITGVYFHIEKQFFKLWI